MSNYEVVIKQIAYIYQSVKWYNSAVLLNAEKGFRRHCHICLSNIIIV